MASTLRTLRDLATVQTTSSEGYLDTHVSIPSPGLVRLDWLAPGGSILYSRSVPVS